MTRKRAFTSPADIVSAARRHRGKTQAAFAADLGRSQGEISRYESGQIDPPSAVLMSCLEIVGLIGDDSDVSIKQLTERIRRELSPTRKYKIRAAVWQLLDIARNS